MFAIIRTRWHTRPLSRRAKRRSSATPGSLRKKYTDIIYPPNMVRLPDHSTTSGDHRKPVLLGRLSRDRKVPGHWRRGAPVLPLDCGKSQRGRHAAVELPQISRGTRWPAGRGVAGASLPERPPHHRRNRAATTPTVSIEAAGDVTDEYPQQEVDQDDKRRGRCGRVERYPGDEPLVDKNGDGSGELDRLGGLGAQHSALGFEPDQHKERALRQL